MRRLEPFSYFVEHASALGGFGGDEKGPDPRYCFHTLYEEVSPGRVVYRLRMTGARASEGELTLRVHAYKPGSNADVGLVGGNKQLLEGLGAGVEGEEVNLAVSFSAVKGVQYALYGFFSEPSDLQVDDIIVTVDELGTSGPDPLPAQRVRSRFAADGFESSSRLYADHSPSLRRPVSQDCTFEQLGADPLQKDLDTSVQHWLAMMPLVVLERYGFLQEGATGVILGSVSAGLLDELKAYGCRLSGAKGAETTSVADGLHMNEPDDPHDFVISYVLDGPTSGPVEREQVLTETMMLLMQGGLAVVFLRYFAQPGISAEMTQLPGRNEIEQLALRLIGSGHDVAQLAFASERQRVVQKDGSTPFVLIVRGG